MAIDKDPEGIQSTILHELIDFKGLRVLEVGCGDGRITWCFADQAAHVTAIDPDGAAIKEARVNLPEALKSRVVFLESTLENFVESSQNRRFDLAIFSWSL